MLSEPNFEQFQKTYLEAHHQSCDSGQFCLTPTSFDERIEVEVSMWPINGVLGEPPPHTLSSVQVSFERVGSANQLTSYWIKPDLSEEALLEEFIRISNELTGMHLCNMELPAFCHKHQLLELSCSWRPITLDAVVEATLFRFRGRPLEHKEMLKELLGIVRNESAKKKLQEFIKYWYGEF